MADGPLTPILSVLCQTDANGNLVVVAGTTSGANSPTNSGNLMVRSNNGALVVAFK